MPGKALYSMCGAVGWQRYLKQTFCLYVASRSYATSIKEMGRGPHPKLEPLHQPPEVNYFDVLEKGDFP